jgi:hypothetical protein
MFPATIRAEGELTLTGHSIIVQPFHHADLHAD